MWSKVSKAALAGFVILALFSGQAPVVLADTPVNESMAPIPRLKVHISEEKIEKNTYTVGAVDFPVPRDSLWPILTDYKNASKTFANLSVSEVLEHKENNLALHQVVKPGYFPFTFDYVVDLTETYPDKIEWRRRSGAFTEYIGSWRLEPTEDGKGTHVTYSVYLDANKFIPQWLMRRSLHGYMPEVFDSLRKELNRKRSRLN